MTYEEALEIIQQYHYGNAVDSSKYMSAMDLVEFALEKQIPKKPIYVEDTDVIHFNWQCPNCKREYMQATHGVNCCSDCGQALLWEE